MELLLIIFLCMTVIEVLALVVLIFITNLKKKSYKIHRIVIKKKAKVIEKKKFKLKDVSKEQWVIFGFYVLVIGFIAYISLSNYMPEVMTPINSGEYSISLENPTNSLKVLYFSKDIFDDKLIIPDLSDYEKVGDFEDSEVWIKRDLVKESYIDQDTLNDFIYFNFPGASVYSFKELDKGVPVLTDWASTETRIDTTFRASLKLAVYHGGGDLNLKFTKQDLNGYVGKDEYNLSVIDFSTGKIVYSEIFKDDGDKKDSKILGDEEDYNVNINLDRGIYYLDFKEDKNNPSADSTLKNFKISSNKVLIVGDMLVYEPNQKFFTKANNAKEIKFKYWWDGKEQHIYFTGDKIFTENINKDNYIIEGENVFVKIPIKIKDETSKYKFQVLDKDKFIINKIEIVI